MRLRELINAFRRSDIAVWISDYSGDDRCVPSSILDSISNIKKSTFYALRKNRNVDSVEIVPNELDLANRYGLHVALKPKTSRHLSKRKHYFVVLVKNIFGKFKKKAIIKEVN